MCRTRNSQYTAKTTLTTRGHLCQCIWTADLWRGKAQRYQDFEDAFGECRLLLSLSDRFAFQMSLLLAVGLPLFTSRHNVTSYQPLDNEGAIYGTVNYDTLGLIELQIHRVQLVGCDPDALVTRTATEVSPIPLRQIPPMDLHCVS